MPPAVPELGDGSKLLPTGRYLLPLQRPLMGQLTPHREDRAPTVEMCVVATFYPDTYPAARLLSVR